MPREEGQGWNWAPQTGQKTAFWAPKPPLLIAWLIANAKRSRGAPSPKESTRYDFLIAPKSPLFGPQQKHYFFAANSRDSVAFREVGCCSSRGAAAEAGRLRRSPNFQIHSWSGALNRPNAAAKRDSCAARRFPACTWWRTQCLGAPARQGTLDHEIRPGSRNAVRVRR